MPPKYVVCRKFRFAAAHYLPDHPKCGTLHGHNYEVEVFVEGPTDVHGMVIDFSILKKLYNQHVASVVDHRCLNDVLPEIGDPTAENLACWIFHRLSCVLEPWWPAHLTCIRVQETPDCYVEVTGCASKLQ